MNLIKPLILLAFSLVSAIGFAQNSTDWGEIVPDQTYSYEAMKPVSGFYTPSESGVLQCYVTGDVIHAYEDPDFENVVQYTNFYYSSNGEKVKAYDVTAGKTIYFGNPFPMDKGTFRISVGKEDIKVNHITPSPERPLSLSTAYKAEIAFNIAVKCSKCKLQVNEVSAELTPDVIDSFVEIEWFNILRQWYNEGKISKGDVLTLTLTGVRDAYDSSNRPDFGDGVGTLVVRYTMEAAPAELIAQSGTPASGTPDFYSYYLPGSDSGLVTLEFSQPLDAASRPSAELQYGDIDNLDLGIYTESLPVKVDGNTLTVDLQGVARFPDKMVPGLPVQPTITLVVSNIKSADGQYVLTGRPANMYSFGFSYNFKTVSYSIAADWLPLPGSSLSSGQEMEVWVLNGAHILFDSVDFAYVKNGEPAKASVPFSDLKVTPDYGDDVIFNFAAPAMDADPDTEITVTFGGLQCADGLDHSSDIFVRYKSSTTGVELLPSAGEDAVFYDLTGRRVIAPSKGIYICNGKKIVIK